MPERNPWTRCLHRLPGKGKGKGKDKDKHKEKDKGKHTGKYDRKVDGSSGGKADRRGAIEALLMAESDKAGCYVPILSAGDVCTTHWSHQHTELLFDTCAGRSVCPPGLAPGVAVREPREPPLYQADGTQVSHVGPKQGKFYVAGPTVAASSAAKMGFGVGI